MGIDVPDDPDVAAGISLTYAAYLEAVIRLREVDFPIERDPAEAWPHFVGWRVNYERAAYAIAAAVDVVPSLWSGPRRRETGRIPPLRPMPGGPEPPQPASALLLASQWPARSARSTGRIKPTTGPVLLVTKIGLSPPSQLRWCREGGDPGPAEAGCLSA